MILVNKNTLTVLIRSISFKNENLIEMSPSQQNEEKKFVIEDKNAGETQSTTNRS